MTPDEPPAPHHEFLCDKLMSFEMRDIMRMTVSLPPGHAKTKFCSRYFPAWYLGRNPNHKWLHGGHALALDTPVPTPSGFKNICDLVVGDEVFGPDGGVTKIVRKSAIFSGNRCFRATTFDGASVVVDADHLWTVKKYCGAPGYSTLTTLQLFERQVEKKTASRAMRLPVTEAVVIPDKELPIDPYVLGYWLGDGDSARSRITVHQDDQAEVRSYFESAGYVTKALSHPQRFTVSGLREKLRLLGVLNNKHIPNVYLWGSVQQRQRLIQGLMDSDGHIPKDGVGMEFDNKDKHLVDLVRQVLWSLGVENRIFERRTVYQGKDCGPIYRLHFMYADAFRLRRKAALAENWVRTRKRGITFEEVTSVDTQCIKVARPDGLFLVGVGFIVTHNSQDFAENEFGKYVRDIIADDKYREVFEDIRLHPASKAAGNWRLAQFRGGYVCKGVGQKIAGYRGNAGGGDDLIGSRADAQSPTIRKNANDWLFTDFRTRFLPNSPIFLVATRWHPEDVIGFVETMNKEGRGIPWDIINLNGVVETEDEARVDPMGRSVGEVLWPGFYDFEHLMELKATLLPSDWWALYKGKPTDQEGGVVSASWFKRYTKLPMKDEIRRISVSVDCAEKDTARAKYTAIGVWIEDIHRRHYLVNVVRKKLEFTQMVAAINEQVIEYNAKSIIIEDAGAGTQYIQQQGTNAPAPIVVIPKSGQSKHFRFDGVAPMFKAGEVYLPETAPWLADYEQELLIFPGTYTDQVDMTSQYLAGARNRRSYGTKRMRGAASASTSRRAA